MVQAGLLIMIAGFADAHGFLKFQAFAGQMTGNTILLAIAAFRSSWQDAAFFAAVIVSFLVGVFVSGGLVRHAFSPALPLSPAAIALAVCAFLVERHGAYLLAFAMGLQNAAATRFGRASLNTVFITGDLQRLFERLIARLWPRPQEVEKPAMLDALALVWVEYFGGALLGALTHMRVPHALLIPAVVLPFVMLKAWRRR
jgi:uncharacterized membrane protein YoaK (UPF0700 family)